MYKSNLRSFIIGGAALVLMTFSLSGCYLLPREEDILAPPLIEPAVVEYATQVIEKSDIQQIVKATGKFKSVDEEVLSFESRGGYISEILVSFGDKVKEGDVLIHLDDDQLIRDKEQAELDYEISKLVTKATYGSTNKKIAALREEKAQSVYLEACEQLAKAQMVAPVDGTITYMANIHVGDRVSARDKIFIISDPDNLYLVVQGSNVHEFDQGDEVTVIIDDRNHEGTYEGIVLQSPTEIEENDALDFSEATTVIEVFDVPEGAIYMNTDAKVELIVATRTDTIVVNNSALESFNGRTFVYVLQDGIKVERYIEIGITTINEVEITNGLEVGDIVIIN